MSLNLQKLIDGVLSKVYGDLAQDPAAPPPQQYAKVAKAWAEAYGAYAADALSCGGKINRSLLPPAKAALAGALAAGLQAANASPPGNPANSAAAYAAAFSAFWVNPLLWTPIPPALPATLVVPVGAPVLQAGLISYWAGIAAGLPASVVPSKEESAKGMSALIDAFTRTVTVTHPLPPPAPPCALPIS